MSRLTRKTAARGLLLAVPLLALFPLASAHPDPHSHGPYHETYEAEGLIGCSFSFMYLQGTDYCALHLPSFLGGGAIDPNANGTFYIAIDAGITAMVVWLDSEASIPVGANALLMEWSTPVAAIPALEGEAPLQAQYQFTHETHAWTQEPLDGRFHVKASPNAGTPQLAYQQEIHICIGLFYNDMPVPDGYQPCPNP